MERMRFMNSGTRPHGYQGQDQGVVAQSDCKMNLYMLYHALIVGEDPIKVV